MTTVAASRPLALALQGGGSHGAFTWGVLDRLLEEPDLAIEGISGASAGAMNAVVLAYGHALGGRDGARRALADFWETVARAAPFAHVPPGDAAAAGALSAGMSPALAALLALGRFFSPVQLDPFDLNPLRRIVASQIDFERLRATATIRLFIAATEVGSGRLRLFRNTDLSLDALLASACVPTLHRPIEIDGKAYWDGGLAANPPLYSLVHKCDAADVIAVLLHPWRDAAAPTTAPAIAQRLMEIGFASKFLSQLHGLTLAKQEAERDPHGGGRYERKLRRLKLHVIDDEALMRGLDTASRLNTHPAFLRSLRERGRDAAEAWLDRYRPRRRVTRHFVRLARFLPDHPTMYPG